MSKRKILIISHNPISDSDNMGKTLKNIFQYFDKDEICQIYLRNQEPNFKVCNNYFYISEISVLKSIVLFMNKTGIKVDSQKFVDYGMTESNMEKQSIRDRLYYLGKKRRQSIYLFRNLIWSIGRWFSSELKDWLNEQKPTCIFCASGDYSFLFQITLKISRYLNIPVYSYYVDEYYNSKMKKDIIPIEGYLYRKKFKKFFLYSKANFCISEGMRNLYQELFKRETYVLMNVCLNIINKDIDFKKSEIKMNYFGNLESNRWKNLSDISTCIRKLNNKNRKKIIFSIYSEEDDPEVLDKFLSNPDVCFKGKLNSDELQSEILKTDILVHTESFDINYINIVKYSISTKIPESLGSGNLLLAYGPRDVESIDYLISHNAAFVIDESSKLEELLEKLYTEDNFSEILFNSKKLVKKNHLANKNSKMLMSFFDGN